MLKKSEKKIVLTAVTLAGAVAFGAAHAAQNPFAMQDLGKGYQVAADDKAMDAKCGGDKAKAKDAKCGGDKAKDTKAKDAKCGGDKAKAKDAGCGGNKK